MLLILPIVFPALQQLPAPVSSQQNQSCVSILVFQAALVQTLLHQHLQLPCRPRAEQGLSADPAAQGDPPSAASAPKSHSIIPELLPVAVWIEDFLLEGMQNVLQS